ncbi:hypothetical protein [Ancylobacter radicis]|uniref:Uncharacterized protein n=1 Tax=Ancylobacter radicis TaxID=2836179 RepID=A0ABS5RCA8_9HYPH|nr:hypothetical protein [Ancylobacter radicis]MBS9479308.1 hypothetical protein [Ancylobacter radicis]
MIFSPGEAVLFVALVVTSVCVVLMYRKLGALSAYQRDYRVALDDSANALHHARNAMALLNDDSRELLMLLSHKIQDAETLLWRLEHAQNAARNGKPGAGPAGSPPPAPKVKP